MNARNHARPGAYLLQHPLLLATVFYVVMLLLALLLRALWFDGWFHNGDLGPPSPGAVLAAVALTLAVLAGTPWSMRFPWARRLAGLIAEVFGPLTPWRAVWLGLISGFAEELLFRGALQPMIGLLPAAVLFALAHAVGWWWLFALVMGLVLGLLYAWGANLWPCVLAHAAINAVNLYRLSRQPGRAPVGAPS